MLRYLIDPANAITAFGILCSAVALQFVLAEHFEFAIATALWAMLADHADGIVARRLTNRSPDFAAIGKSLDGFSDIIYGAIFPAVLIIEIGAGSASATITGVFLLLAGAMRLSYFENFGLSDDGRFTGLPLSYDVPILALAFVIDAISPAMQVRHFLPYIFMAIAVLHVAPLKIPSPNSLAYVIILALSVSLSLALILIGSRS